MKKPELLTQQPKWNSPIKEAYLKHLTFKTVFLLALDPGKKSDTRQTSQGVSLPLTQLSFNKSPGQKGSRLYAPVVIPALTQLLDKLLKAGQT